MSPVQELPWELALPLRSSSSERTIVCPWEMFPVRQENRMICWIKLIVPARQTLLLFVCVTVKTHTLEAATVWSCIGTRWTHCQPTKLMYLTLTLFVPFSASVLFFSSQIFSVLLFLADFGVSCTSHHIPVTPALSVQLFSKWESELSRSVSWQLLLCPFLKDIHCLNGKSQCCLTCFPQWEILSG